MTRWWFDFEIKREQLALFRVCFFAILAIDAFLQISHAPRYGAGDFNVPHLPWLPLPEPTREVMVTIDLLLAYLFCLAAFGVAMRVVVPIAAALDFYAYFSSQLDSYQHHYLVVLLLVLACFVPWDDRSRYVKSWALRLVCVQIAILYAWAVIAKIDPQWLDGTALSKQVQPKGLRKVMDGHWGVIAIGVALAEAFLAAAWIERRRLWIAALPIGIAFHVGVELAGFRIGQFSYVMLAIYTLMLPAAAVTPLEKLKLPALDAKIAAGLLAGAILIGFVLFRWAHVPAGTRVGVFSGVIAIGAFALSRHWKVAAAHLAACLLVFGLARTTDQLLDYYRFWGGTARRLGKNDEARAAYQQVLAIDPDHPNAHNSLGLLDLDAGQLEPALAHFRRVQELEPRKARGWVGEAKVHLAAGDTLAANNALQRALGVDPHDEDAQELRARLRPR